MGMSIYILGIVPPDEQWAMKKKAWDACKEANVEPPQELWAFFDGETPDDDGAIMDLRDHQAVKEWNDGDACQSGLQVTLANLPAKIKALRFVNSY